MWFDKRVLGRVPEIGAALISGAALLEPTSQLPHYLCGNLIACARLHLHKRGHMHHHHSF